MSPLTLPEEPPMAHTHFAVHTKPKRQTLPENTRLLLGRELMEDYPIDGDYEEVQPARRGYQRPRWLLLLPILILVLLLWPGWVGFYTEWLWFRELGYERVFSTTLLTKLGLGAVTALAAALLAW